MAVLAAARPARGKDIHRDPGEGLPALRSHPEMVRRSIKRKDDVAAQQEGWAAINARFVTYRLETGVRARAISVASWIAAGGRPPAYNPYGVAKTKKQAETAAIADVVIPSLRDLIHPARPMQDRRLRNPKL